VRLGLLRTVAFGRSLVLAIGGGRARVPAARAQPYRQRRQRRGRARRVGRPVLIYGGRIARRFWARPI
jgi:hypothetical protein